jgi:2-oxoisovalerate dehydrogenase E1 component alpha subunit
MSIVAQFSIEFIQFLNGNGEITNTLPLFAHDSKTLLKLYSRMVFTRAFDAKAVALQRTGLMSTYPSSLGQEAISIAIGHSLDKEDIFIPYYRDQGALLMRGVKGSEIFAYWGGDERGNNYAASHDLPICVPIATQLLHAAGVAYAIKLRKQSIAALTICGDGGTSEGDFYEAINFAGVCTLPLVFVVNSNQWAISVPRKKQTAAQTIAQKAIAAGFEGIQVDGNDVIALCDTIQKALLKAKQGLGPTLIEAVTYRLADHTTADDAKRYVDLDELEKAKQFEPIIRLRRYLEEQGLWSDHKEATLLQECTQEIAAQVEEYQNMETQQPSSMLSYLYAKLPAAYQDQWEELRQIERNTYA